MMKEKTVSRWIRFTLESAEFPQREFPAVEIPAAEIPAVEPAGCNSDAVPPPVLEVARSRGGTNPFFDDFFLVEDLQVDEVVCSVVLAGLGVDECAGMKLLRDLMVQREHRNRCRRLEPQRFEQRDQVVGDP